MLLTKGENSSFSAVQLARRVHCEVGGPFRSPHHSVSDMGLLAELAMAAGGVLLLCEAREFRKSGLQALSRTWAMMHPEHRPLLVVEMGGQIRPSITLSGTQPTADPLEWAVWRGCEFAREQGEGEPLPIALTAGVL